MLISCPVCNNKEFEQILIFEKAPIFQLIKDNEKITDDYFAQLEIVRCQGCKHIYNRAYCEEIATRMYRGDVLSNVPVNISMSKNLEKIAAWFGKPQYINKNVIEIGAGSGHLSRILAQEAQSVLIFEPSIGLRPDLLPEQNITLLNEPFTAAKVQTKVDLIVCRHVLEHLANPLDFLQQIRATLTDDGYFYLEVPSVEDIEKKVLLVDFHYPHVQYFYKPNLLALAVKAGFVTEREWELMDGHDLGVMLRPQSSSLSSQAVPSGLEFSHQLGSNLKNYLLQGHKFLVEQSAQVALYGASWHGVAFLNAFEASCSFVCAFDDNSDYVNHSLYSNQQTIPIYSPTEQKLQDIDIIIITAYLHKKAIAERLREKGFKGKIFCPVPTWPLDLQSRLGE